uniref:Methyltransferase domain-containing protein n=1 Tax=Candidatus Kentrum sp. UNK TaxID=2126344 RepID=A0A451AVR6_9GAMM|nr:MAG: Methyltransferase domain-containing protein [Candidatus Kentron sp. UNK]VFK70125.1 MAG: Methyltransferase domain-containing protein [Candidatus Kentron sp. UNK]
MNSLTRYDSMVFAYQYEHVKGSKPFDEDIEYYCKRARGVAGEVLEFGCGTGKIALRLAENGIRVPGVDNAPSMIEIAKKKSEKKAWKDRVNFQVPAGEMGPGQAPSHLDRPGSLLHRRGRVRPGRDRSQRASEYLARLADGPTKGEERAAARTHPLPLQPESGRRCHQPLAAPVDGPPTPESRGEDAIGHHHAHHARSRRHRKKQRLEGLPGDLRRRICLLRPRKVKQNILLTLQLDIA